MKKLLLFAFMAILFSACEKDDLGETKVNVSFILDNDLLWNIGHDYKVGGIDENGNDFIGEEKYIRYLDILLKNKMIKGGSVLILYKNGNPIWTSDPISKNCTFTYHDSPVSGGDTVDIE